MQSRVSNWDANSGNWSGGPTGLGQVPGALAMMPSFELSANLQVIDGALRGADTAVISGFRGQIVF